MKGQLSEQDVVAYEIFCEILADVERKLEGIEGIDSILYATNDLEAWIAYCLIAQEPCIPVPTCVFPEAVNIDYVYTLYYEAYRQNPTSGMLSLKGYNYDYQLLGVKYCEELDTRLDKTREEIGKAKEVANSITTSSMSDADKVMAINEYLCENASYDYDSCNCDVDFDNLSEPFIDAHTPYGILCKNYGVCESYSEAFALIGRIAGLQVVMESGDLQGGPHEWNRVCVDGSWCVVDVTNNDSDFANPLLNVSEKQIEGVLIPDGYSYLDTYEALDETKEYYYLNGLSTNTDDEAVSLLCSILKNEDCARVRIKPGTSAEDIQNIVQEVCNTEQIDCKYYSFANVIMIEKA